MRNGAFGVNSILFTHQAKAPYINEILALTVAECSNAEFQSAFLLIVESGYNRV